MTDSDLKQMRELISKGESLKQQIEAIAELLCRESFKIYLVGSHEVDTCVVVSVARAKEAVCDALRAQHEALGLELEALRFVPGEVTFSIDRNGRAFHVTTFGETKKLCKLAGHFGDEIVRAINEGQIQPPAVEPFTDPPGSTTWVKKEGK